MSARSDLMRAVAAVLLIGAGSLVAVSGAAGQQQAPPGRSIDDAEPVSAATLATRCVGRLPTDRPGWTAAEIASATCEVAGRGEMPAPDGRWRWALGRHTIAFGASGDTVRVDELVLLFAEERGGRYVPVWHDHGDVDGTELLRPPRAGPLDEGLLLAHRRCLRGTGGCTDWSFRLGEDGSVEPLRRDYLDELRARIPDDWGFRKGVHLDPAARTAEAPVYVPGDANCCPSFRALAGLRVGGDAVGLDSLSVVPDTGSGAWTIDPVRGVGHVRPNTSFESLVRAYGPDFVRRDPAYIGEGWCRPGALIFPDSPEEIEIVWVDSTASRPASVRIGRTGGPWHTPSGVRVGTPLSRLEELRGAPVSFSGFGWDYGGTLSWTEDAGELRLSLTADMSALRARRRSDPRGDELFGEGTVSSDHPLLRGLGIEVHRITINWDRPARGQSWSCR